jgi:hypothetical protein
MAKRQSFSEGDVIDGRYVYQSQFYRQNPQQRGIVYVLEDQETGKVICLNWDRLRELFQGSVGVRHPTRREKRNETPNGIETDGERGPNAGERS